MIRGRPQPGVQTPPQPIRDNHGASILGPTNPPREAQDPDLLAPPLTDHGTLPNLKWSFADSHNHLSEGGWARQTSIRELPIATEIAAVNMRLKAGAVQEMHYHKEAESAYVLAGRARITAVDPELRTFQDDVSEGDLWYFSAGLPHSIQGLADDGCEVLLVVDNAHFDTNSTFLLTDWLAHTPREVLAENFEVPESAFANLPDHELYIFHAPLPGPLRADRIAGAGPVPEPLTHHLLAQEPVRTKGGSFRIGRLEGVQGIQDDCRGPDRDRARGDARAALAPDRRRVAVLPFGRGADGGVRRQWERRHLRLSGG